MAIRKPDMDSTSGIPLPHMSFILNHILPTHHFEIEGILEFDEILKGTNKNTLNYDMFSSGSQLEGLAIPEYRYLKTSEMKLTDYDVLLIDKYHTAFQESADISPVSTDKGPLLIDDTGCAEGFVRLREPSGAWYTIPHIREKLKSMITDRKKYKGTVYDHGPSVGFFHQRFNKDANIPKLNSFLRNCDFSADSVYAIRLNKWPKQAEEWKIRNRPSCWPIWNTIQQITSNGCHLVQVRYPGSPHPEEDWRLSFSAAEQLLVRSLSSVQRKCFVLLKMAVSSTLPASHSPKILSSYHLKTVLLWTCDVIPSSEFTELSVAKRYLKLLDKLITFLKEGNLPNYFVRENNMLSHFSSHDLEAALEHIQKLRRYPLRAFVQFNKENRFLFSLETHGDITDYLAPIFVNIQQISSGNTSEYYEGVLMLTFVYVFHFYTRELKFIEALCALKGMVNFVQFMTSISLSVEAFLEKFLNCPFFPDFTVKMFLHFCLNTQPKVECKTFSTLVSQRCFWSSMARYFLKQSYEMDTKLSPTCKEILNQRIYYTLWKAANMKGSAKDTLETYSWLIFAQRQWGEIIADELDTLQLLQKFIYEERHEIAEIPSGFTFELEEFVSYDKMDHYLVHDPLLRIELDGAGHIRLLTELYLHYLLVVRAVTFHGRELHETQRLLDEMITYFIKAVKPGHAQAFSLFGYVWMYLGNFEAAARSFHVALVLGNSGEHTHRNKWLCLSVMIFQSLQESKEGRTQTKREQYTWKTSQYFLLMSSLSQV